MTEVQGREEALLVISHPDDESMFFGPCIRRLHEEFSWHVLCLSTGESPSRRHEYFLQLGRTFYKGTLPAGNADGLGPQREQELHHACVLLQVLPS